MPCSGGSREFLPSSCIQQGAKTLAAIFTLMMLNYLLSKSERGSQRRILLYQEIRIGDTVTPIAPQEKHKVRDIYLVTGKDGEKVPAQGILHPLSDNPIKFMSRNYKVNLKHLITIHHP